MNKMHRVGIAGIVLMVVAGAWLFFAPFMFGYQPQGKHWVSATRNDLWTGGLLTLVAVVALLGIAAATVSELIRAHDGRAQETSDGLNQTAQSVASSSEG